VFSFILQSTPFPIASHINPDSSVPLPWWISLYCITDRQTVDLRPAPALSVLARVSKHTSFGTLSSYMCEYRSSIIHRGICLPCHDIFLPSTAPETLNLLPYNVFSSVTDTTSHVFATGGGTPSDSMGFINTAQFGHLLGDESKLAHPFKSTRISINGNALPRLRVLRQ
jgi:hypothetical protein